MDTIVNEILVIARRRRRVGKHYQAMGRKLARQRALCAEPLTSAYLKRNAHWDGLDKRGL